MVAPDFPMSGLVRSLEERAITEVEARRENKEMEVDTGVKEDVFRAGPVAKRWCMGTSEVEIPAVVGIYQFFLTVFLTPGMKTFNGSKLRYSNAKILNVGMKLKMLP